MGFERWRVGGRTLGGIALSCGLVLGCSGPSTPPRPGRGHLELFLLYDGTAVLSATFEPSGACPPRQTSGPCSLDDGFTAFECAGPGPDAANAGTLTVSADGISDEVVPDDVGFYRDTTLAGVKSGMPLHVHADGGTVPAFDADVTIPEAAFALSAPAPDAVVSFAAPLDVAWAATGSAPFSDVRVIGQDASAGSLSVFCDFPGGVPEAQVPADLLTGFDPSAKTFVSVKAAIRTKAHPTGWDIDVRGEGAFDLVNVTITK